MQVENYGVQFFFRSTFFRGSNLFGGQHFLVVKFVWGQNFEGGRNFLGVKNCGVIFFGGSDIKEKLNN